MEGRRRERERGSDTEKKKNYRKRNKVQQNPDMVSLELQDPAGSEGLSPYHLLNKWQIIYQLHKISTQQMSYLISNPTDTGNRQEKIETTLTELSSWKANFKHENRGVFSAKEDA